jgi:hypothetical protein
MNACLRHFHKPRTHAHGEGPQALEGAFIRVRARATLGTFFQVRLQPVAFLGAQAFHLPLVDKL